MATTGIVRELPIVELRNRASKSNPLVSGICISDEKIPEVIELDPKDFLAQYNLGNIKLSVVIEFHKKVLDIADVNEYNKEMEKVFEGYESVIPYFEKALELNPDEKNTVTTLKELYFKLRNKDPKYQEAYDVMKAKLDNIQ